MFTIPKPALGIATCPGSISLGGFTSPNISTPEPANLAGSSATGYIVGNHTSTSLRMITITGTAGSPVAHDLGDIKVAAYSSPANLPQPGSTDRVDTSDTRLTQATGAADPALGTGVFAIWTQHTVAGPSNAGSVVRWYELKPGQATPVQAGTIASPWAGGFAFNAGIAPNSTGKGAAISYNTASASFKITLRARIHAIGAAPGTTTGETLLATSSGIVNDFSCPSHTGGTRPCRWGDYAGASTDPLGGNAVWGTAEYEGAVDTTNFSARWLTQNMKLIVH
jgi:hypothetical protein